MNKISNLIVDVFKSSPSNLSYLKNTNYSKVCVFEIDGQRYIYKQTYAINISNEVFFYKVLSQNAIPTVSVLDHGELNELYSYYFSNYIEATAVSKFADSAKLTLSKIWDIKTSGFGYIQDMLTYSFSHSCFTDFIDAEIARIRSKLLVYKDYRVADKLDEIYTRFRLNLDMNTQPHLIHGDLSEKNLINSVDMCYFIDPGKIISCTTEYELAKMSYKYSSDKSFIDSFVRSMDLDLAQYLFFRYVHAVDRYRWVLSEKRSTVRARDILSFNEKQLRI